MSRLQTFNMPDVGEGLTEAEVLEWKIAVGDDIAVNQIIVEIETAKAAVELPSPYAGRVHALLVEPGVTVDVGTPIITVDTDPNAGPLPSGDQSAQSVQPVRSAEPASAGGEGGAKIGEAQADGRIATLVGLVDPNAGTTRRARRSRGVEPDAAPVVAVAKLVVEQPVSVTRSAAPKAAPPVRKLAKDLGVDLATISAARADGVITRDEVQAAASGAAVTPTQVAASAPATFDPATFDPATRERRVPIKGVRKMTAAAMVSSAFTAPHVTEFLTIDVTPMMELRDRLRRRPEFAETKLSPLAFCARAVCLASRRTPEINSVWDADAGEIVFKDYVNLGIAAATPRGLIVPNIRDAGSLDLLGLASALAELTGVARSGKTPPEAMTAGTFTITNVGVFGVDTGTPIINPGESAILALGSIKDAPWVVDGALAVRKVLQLALSFDHRVIDGQQGSQFLADVGALLADPGLAMTY